MRIVYRNAGETDALIGLYPYEPLHDMRRALETLDPRLTPEVPNEQKALARDAILQAFNALRETFLEELDLEEPQRPILAPGSRRQKSRGAARSAFATRDKQHHRLKGKPSARPDVDGFLATLRPAEESPGKGDKTPPA